jgi:hypothetical protein
MKALLAAILAFPLALTRANTVTVGGSIQAIHSVACTARRDLDFSRDGKEERVATCVINNNLPWFQETFRFAGDGAGFFQRPGIRITSLTFHGLGGELGQGVPPPSGRNILPEAQSQDFVWPGVEQHSSTINYVVEFRASWKALPRGKDKQAAEPDPASEWMTLVMGSSL